MCNLNKSVTCVIKCHFTLILKFCESVILTFAPDMTRKLPKKPSPPPPGRLFYLPSPTPFPRRRIYSALAACSSPRAAINAFAQAVLSTRPSSSSVNASARLRSRSCARTARALNPLRTLLRSRKKHPASTIISINQNRPIIPPTYAPIPSSADGCHCRFVRSVSSLHSRRPLPTPKISSPVLPIPPSALTLDVKKLSLTLRKKPLSPVGASNPY